MTEKIEPLPTKLGEPINGVRQVVIDFEAALAQRDATIDRAERENARLREELIPFIAVHAVNHARVCGLDGLHPQFYDRLKELGARMDDFKRAALAETEGKS